MQQKYEEDIEQYLEQLTRKIAKHVKNPFTLPMLNYQFQQLHGWKNATLQLDASTKIYGLRVDNLHQTMMKVFNNVSRNSKNDVNEGVQCAIEHIIEKQRTTDSQNQIEKCLGKYLQKYNNISSQAQSRDIKDYLNWKLIVQPYQNISDLLLNKLPLSPNLILSSELEVQKQSQKLQIESQPSQFQQLLSKLPNINFMDIFLKVKEIKQQALTLKIQNIREDIQKNKIKQTNFTDFQLGNFNIPFQQQIEELSHGQIIQQQFHQFTTEGLYNRPDIFLQFPQIQQPINKQQIAYEQQTQLSQSPASQVDPYQNQWSKTEKLPKKKCKRNQKKTSEKPKKQAQPILFRILPQQREFVLFPEKFKSKKKFNLTKMDLSVGFPLKGLFKKVRQVPIASNKLQLFREEQRVEFNDYTFFETQAGQSQSLMPIISKSKITGHVSIKKLKVSLQQLIKNSKISTIMQVKSIFADTDPLDIFAACLHLAHDHSFYLQKTQPSDIKFIFDRDI